MVSASNFVLGVFLTRFLGVGEYGVFVLAWMVVVFFSSLQHALIVGPLVTLMPKRPAGERPRYGTAFFVLQLAYATAAAVITALGGLLLSEIQPASHYDALIIPLAAAVFAFLWQDYMRRMLFAQRNTGPVLTADLLAYGGQVAAVFIAHRLGFLSIPSMFWCIAALFTTSALLQMRWVVLESCSWRSLSSIWHDGWRFSRWIAASAITQWFTSNLFIVAAGALLGGAAAGAVRASQNVVGVTHVLFLALDNVLPARAAMIMAEEGRAAMLQYMRRATGYAGAVTAGGLLLVAIAPGFWLQTLYGPELAGYGFVLSGFALLYLLVFVNTMIRQVMRTLELTRPFFISSVVTAGLSITIAFPMVQQWGVAGVLIGLVVTQIVGMACLIPALYQRG